ncbi:MAG: DUF480 domain-containing protein [Phycisphaerales bacterium]|nr:DUF480 domain-containing protein [Phycisphaerales bacterium]
METKLNQIERRVLGVLMEKALTQPDYYPMTVNAVVIACNQKSNRDPVMDLDELAVLDTLESFKRRGLVGQVLPAPGARVDRYKHLAESCWGWSARQRAIMTELLLRGPQTIGELRTHASRMIDFESLDIVNNVLETLMTGESVWVAAMPREPGRSAIRYTHLLYPEGEQMPAAALLAAIPTPVASLPGSHVESDRLAALEKQVADLHETLVELTSRLDRLEGR